MKPIRSLQGMEDLVKESPPRKISVAYAQDEDTLVAVNRAVREKVVEAILFGDREVISSVCARLNISVADFTVIHEPDEQKCGEKAVKLIVDGEAQILMKGLIATPYFLKAILNKELNVVPRGATLSHTALIEVPTYDKLLFVSDVAMIPYPDLGQKVQMINYNVAIARKLGIINPLAAIVTANEKVSDKMPCTMEAAIISKMADRQQIKGVLVDGPLALDVALSRKACEIKGLKSVVNGYADILIMPNIESGNIFYKSTTILARGKLAAVVTGASFPAILTSRAEDDDSKYYSIVLAAAMV